MAIEFNPIKPKAGAKTQGAFLADNNQQKKTKFDEQIAAAYNGATGYVSPPANNIMGFGPAAENA